MLELHLFVNCVSSFLAKPHAIVLEYWKNISSFLGCYLQWNAHSMTHFNLYFQHFSPSPSQVYTINKTIHEAVICRICWFLWCECSHHGWFQTTPVRHMTGITRRRTVACSRLIAFPPHRHNKLNLKNKTTRMWWVLSTSAFSIIYVMVSLYDLIF